MMARITIESERLNWRSVLLLKAGVINAINSSFTVILATFARRDVKFQGVKLKFPCFIATHSQSWKYLGK